MRGEIVSNVFQLIDNTFDFDACLERFEGRKLKHLLIIAAEDTLEIDGNCTRELAVYLMELAKQELLKDDDE